MKVLRNGKAIDMPDPPAVDISSEAVAFRVESGRSPQFLDGRRHAIKWAVQYLHDRVKEMNDPNAKEVLNCAAFHMGVDAKRALPLPEPPPDPRSAPFKVPAHVRKLMDIYRRIHEEIEAGKPWDEIDIGFRDGQRSTYDFWDAYMRESLINAWDSAILDEEDHRPIPAAASDPRDALIGTDVSDAAIAEFAADRERLDAENAKMRQILSECATAIGNGAHASPECSIEFLSWIPGEVAAERKRLNEQQERYVTVLRHEREYGGKLNATIARLSSDLEAAREALDRFAALDPDGARAVLANLAPRGGRDANP